MKRRHSNRGFIFVIIGLVAGSVITMAQTTKPSSEMPIDISATSVNVNGAGEGIDFHIVKWSTDADRDKLSALWNPPPAAAAPAAAPAPAPRGAGGGRGAAAPSAAPKTPEGALATALAGLPGVGYFWTSETAGYLVRYAYRVPLPTGGNRIILLTDHRLGFSKKNWQPMGAATPNNYEFTLIELRIPATGDGEGKASLTGKIAIDPATKSLTLDGYDALSVVMKGVKLRPKN